ncbi:MAG: SDR family oxidoreductase [Marivita sp.]|uniref:SDR family oxidoreductase n=1 Tax=Marivita sp. TaxID=2003365 RepID=UPI0025C3BDD9|nr:SDR family oxidoreductase [Marivita sp.]MCI5112828.1 SDR family oxidoreductase [Marivita sp.]
MTIAISGASGQLGRIAVQALKSHVDAGSIIALARDTAKVADLGVETRAFDYTKPETLQVALLGVDVLALVSSSDFADRVGQHENVITAAQAAGVGRIIYTSILKADQSPLLIARDHRKTEEILTNSGITYTILRNPWYFENWTASLPIAVEQGAMIGATGDGKTTPATRQDLGEALAAVAAGNGHDNMIYELGADTAITLNDMAAALSRHVGRAIPYNDLPKDSYAGILASVGLPEGFAAVIADAEAGIPEGWLSTDSGDLSRLIGRPTTTLDAAVAEALQN